MRRAVVPAEAHDRAWAERCALAWCWGCDAFSSAEVLPLLDEVERLQQESREKSLGAIEVSRILGRQIRVLRADNERLRAESRKNAYDARCGATGDLWSAHYSRVSQERDRLRAALEKYRARFASVDVDSDEAELFAALGEETKP